MKVQGFKRFVEDFDIELTTKTSEIIQIVGQMDSDELEDFAQWLYAELYDEDSEDFTKEEVIEMVNELDSESLDYVLYMLSDDFEADEDFEDDEVEDDENFEDDEDDEVEDDADDEKYFEKCLDEKRFFKIRKSALDRAKKTNVAQRRKNKKAAKLNYRKHKSKIKLQNKKYRKKVKRNPNLVRTHR